MRAPEVDVAKFEYPSGLVLLVAEQHYAEVASVQAWCQTGSIHEGKWLGAGMTHLLEHMLFKGTQKRTALRLSEEIHQVGGYLNAYTSFDRTVFWADCPKGAVETALELARTFDRGQEKTIVLTVAMVPYAFGSSDGLFNLGSALSFVQALPPGIYVAMNGRCFAWDRVRKNKATGVFEEIT